MLRDRAVVVTGGDTAVGAELAEGLHDRGALVAVVPGELASRADAVEALDGALARMETDRFDMLVHVPIVADALRRAPLATLGEAAWDSRCEAVLRAALWACQAAHDRMQPRGGRIVLVTATDGLVGARERAPFATAMEGMRSLAKVAARQWGSLGITLNCLAITLDESPAGPLPPAIGRSINARRDLAAAVEMLAGDAGAVITGATIPVDGGVVMTP